MCTTNYSAGIKITIMFLVFFSNMIFAQAIQLTATSNRPTIDGNIESNEWAKATLFSNFKTMKPEYGRSPSEKIDFFLIYDDENIYAAVICYDKDPDKLKASFAKRDGCFSDDWFAFCLDAYNNDMNVYAFIVNPLGMQADGILNSKGELHFTLDTVPSMKNKSGKKLNMLNQIII